MTGNTQEPMSNSRDSGCGCLLSLIVLGLLGLLFVPSYFRTSSYGHGQSEGRNYVGAMNRGQQAYFLEQDKFSDAIPALGLGIKTETQNYTYSTRVTDKAAFNYGIARSDQYTYKRKYFGLFYKKVRRPSRSYVGGVFIIPATNVDPNAAADELTTISILCEAVAIGATKPAEPTYLDDKPICGEGTIKL
ncbi:MAG: general secretion pathway protein GspH [Symploca sp. SIO1B1]|nr:general secretion pathway protein GspH [Symploca sp. SIO1B1]